MTDQLSSMSQKTFCARNEMGPTKFRSLSIKPRMMFVDGMARISLEAERDWRKACEQAALSPTAAKHRKKVSALKTEVSRKRFTKA